MVRLTDRVCMTLDVYRGRKKTTQQQQIVQYDLGQVPPTPIFMGFKKEQSL